MAETDNRESWYADLKAVYDALAAGGVRPWLWLGTFLGAVRDHGIMPWDHDIDLACRWEDGACLPAVFAALREQGFEVRPRDSAPCGWPFIVKLYRRAPIDLLCLCRIGDWRVMVKGTRLRDGAEYLTWWNEARYCEELGEAQCGTETYAVPAPSEELLAYWYGPGWQVPAGDKSSHPARNPIRCVPQGEFLAALEEGAAWAGTLPG